MNKNISIELNVPQVTDTMEALIDAADQAAIREKYIFITYEKRGDPVSILLNCYIDEAVIKPETACERHHRSLHIKTATFLYNDDPIVIDNEVDILQAIQKRYYISK